MLDQVAAQLEAAVRHVSLLAFGLSFCGGLLTGFNPCVYPTIPAIIGYIGAQEERSRLRAFFISLAFVVGLGITYMVLGAFACFLKITLIRSPRLWHYGLGLICVAVGIHLSGLYRVRFARSSLAHVLPPPQRGIVGAVLLGILFGIAATPCATPILLVLAALGSAGGNVVYAASLLFVYALGHGLPLLIIGTCTGAVASLARFTRWSPRIQQVGGALLILVGFYFLWRA
jgi:cytochrome c-type biogenesis protein